MLKTTQTCYLTILEFRGPKIKVSSGCISAGDSRGESMSLPPPDSRGPLHSLQHLPVSVTDSAACFHHHISSDSPASLLYKDPYDHIGFTQIIQNNLPISRSSSQSHLQVPFAM